MADFLFHEVSEKEREEIRKQAKGIMDSFAKELAKVDKKVSEPIVEREEWEREEGKGEDVEIDRNIMFENAPQKKGDFIVAEKGGWR